MTTLAENVTFIVATLTFVSNILFVFIMSAIFFSIEFRKFIYDFVNKYVLQLLLTFSLTAGIGSLIYSNIVGFPPCELCWIQRILMYPQFMILPFAMWKNDRNIVDYLAPMTVVGLFVSFYHSLAHWGFNSAILDCTAVGGECAKVYVLEYGYVTIPFMAFTSFAYLLVISILYYESRKNR